MNRFPVVVLLLIAACLGGACLWAQEEFAPLSVSAPGGFRAIRINPAALAAGDAEGIALTVDVSNALQSGEISRAFEDISLSLSLAGLGYAYEENDPSHFHTVALAHRVVRNLYAGGSVRVDAGGVDPLNFDLGLLARPFDFLSLGAVATLAAQGSPGLRLGLGLRPFASHPYLGDRLTLTTDIAYQQEAWQGLRIGLQTELIDGLGLDAGFDFGRNAFSAGLSFAAGHLRSGTRLGLNADNRLDRGDIFLHLSPRLFRPARFGSGYFSNALPGPQDYFVDYRPGPRLLEEEPGRALGPFYLVGEGHTIRQVLQEIERLTEDRQVAGLLLRDHHLESSYANFLELQEALQRFRSTGRLVVFYFEAADNLNYALAAAVGDQVFLHPHGYLDLKGFAVARPYLKGLFDALGIGIENFRSHEHKTAYNFLSEEEMTAAERENLETFLEGEYRHLITMIRKGRGTRITRPVGELIEEGPFLVAEQALQAGLVDELLYEDQLPKKLKALAGLVGPEHKVIRPAGPALAERVRTDWSDPPQEAVAYITASGSIHRGEGQPGVSVGSRTLALAIREARENPAIKGILLRVDSPGGSALASDVIAREVALCREGENAKPVVVSMAGVAASGGYYIAAPAYRIVAQPVTLTGSIGVVSLNANLEELFENLMIHWDTVKTGEQADQGAVYRSLTEEEREKIRQSVQDSYRTFLATVASGREMDRETVHRMAQGRIWTGQQARERGLVDELGGLETSLAVLKELLGTGHELRLVSYPRRGLRIPLGTRALTRLTGSRAAVLQTSVPELAPLLDLYREYSRYGNERVLMVLPYRFDLQGPSAP